MKILFLDDDEERHAGATRALIGHEVTHVRTVEEALAALRGTAFDVAMLDHDLGGTHYAASDATSGYAVASAIAQGDVQQPGYVVVDSFNPAGAVRMVQALAGGGVPALWAPYGPVAFRIAHSEALEVR